MTKTLYNHDNHIVYMATKQDGSIEKKQISNYSLVGLFEIEQKTCTMNTNEITEKLALRLTKENCPNKSYLKIIDGDNESDHKSFFKDIHSKIVGLYEDFCKSKFILLMKFLHHDLPTVTTYTNFGYQHGENIYVTANKIFNHNTGMLENYPKFPDNFSLNEKEKLQILSFGSCQPIIYDYENPKLILDDLVREFLKTFQNPAVIAAFGIIIATAFFDLFIQYKQGFPYVMLYGDSQTGKTTILRICSSIFGITNFTKLTSGTSTKTILRELLSKYNNIPAFIEEVDKYRIRELEDIGKDSFSATPRKKSSKDGKEIVTEINTSFCIATNNFIENMTFANFSRCIPVSFREKQFDLVNFSYHEEFRLKKLSCILPLILSFRDKILEKYDSEYEIAQKYCSYPRICNNMAISMAIWNVINEILGTEVINTDTLAKDYFEYFSQYLDTEVSYGDKFLADVYGMYKQQKIFYGSEFVITKRKYLRINLTKYCYIYNSLHENQTINPNQLRLKLKNDKRFIDLKGSDLKPIGRAIRVDISDNTALAGIGIFEQTKSHSEREQMEFDNAEIE